MKTLLIPRRGISFASTAAVEATGYNTTQQKYKVVLRKTKTDSKVNAKVTAKMGEK